MSKIGTVTLEALYGNKAGTMKKRYYELSKEFEALFGEKPVYFFSASGRTEVVGNHTDHNHGKVLAAAVDLDVIAAVVPTNNGIITVKSQSYPIDEIDSSDLEIKENEKNTSASLIRGVCAGLKNRGYAYGGFKAYTMSDVLKGSGLSSSAAFEVLIVTILNHLYNDGKVSDVAVAQISQYAENVYFGKPSGLMDQMASSVGGFISIDFADTENPVIESMNFDLAKNGHSLCIIDTKGNHADLTPEYAAIPVEMKAVASHFGTSVLRELDKNDIISNAVTLREKFGDRAVLRSLHFFDENDRVDEMSKALKSGDFAAFLDVIKRSGTSSYKYLQNVYANVAPDKQGVSLALYIAENLLQGEGACRVHGGGFAGTIQAFVPNDKLADFKTGIEAVFGVGSCYVLNIRSYGGTRVEFAD
ncbi:MAG: galactokinase [Oscillospiraceae bacterium]|nr:galactokinase [Oscillospiraceae bacterium]